MNEKELLEQLMDFVNSQFDYNTFITFCEDKGYTKLEIETIWETLEK
jgi:hypothetical protein